MYKVLFVLLLACLVSSCAEVYYPQHINTSFIEEKGETNIGGAISLSSLNIQASSAITDNFRLAGGLNYWGWSVTLGSASSGSSGLQSQLLAGYYKKLRKNVFFEGYGGVGASLAHEDFFSRGIVQTSLGFGNNKPVFVITVRANYLDNTLFADPDSGAILGPGETNRISAMFYDFALTHRITREKRTWFLQYGMSRDVEKFGDTSFIPFLNFGVNFRLLGKSE